MITGIIGIKFNENVSGIDIQKAISLFYKTNEKLIMSMQYVEFSEPSVLDGVFNTIAEISKNKDKQTKLVME